MSEGNKNDHEKSAAQQEIAPKATNKKKLVREKSDEILEKLINNEITEEESQWIEDIYHLSIINSALPNPKTSSWLTSHTLIALICVVLGGLLMVFRVGDFPMINFLSTNNVSIHVRCKAFTTALTDTSDPNIISFDEQIVTDHLEINKLNTIAVSNTTLAIHKPTPTLNLKVDANPIYLEEIELNPNATINVRPFNNTIFLSTTSQRLKAKATFKSAEFSQPIREKVYSEEEFGIPLFARFESVNSERSNIVIRFMQNGPVSILTGKKINLLEFSNSYVFGADILKYVSTIQSGSLILNDVSRTIDLHKRDRLTLQGLEGWITDLVIENDTVDLFFKGTVRNIRAGPEGLNKDLSPRLLEYFFENQPFALFWGSIVFLWGFLNGVVARFRNL